MSMHTDTEDLNNKLVQVGLKIEYNHESMRDRIAFLDEELGELKAAHHMAGVFSDRDDNPLNEKADMLDALVDIVVVAMGTAYQCGWDFETAWKRVHDANMLKTAVSNESVGSRTMDFDLKKPEGWCAPVLQDCVK